jgi:hypothetical protein
MKTQMNQCPGFWIALYTWLSWTDDEISFNCCSALKMPRQVRLRGQIQMAASIMMVTQVRETVNRGMHAAWNLL